MSKKQEVRSVQTIVSKNHQPVLTKQQVNSLVHQALRRELEPKYVVSSISVSVDFGGALSLISSVAQADTDTSREGDKIRAKRIQIKGQFTVGDTTNVVRIALVRWRPATTPTAAQAWEDVGTALSPLSVMPQHDYAPSMIVLKEWCFSLNTYHPTALFEADFPVDWTLTYISGSQTTQENGLFLAYISDSAAASHPTLVCWTKFTYIDI